MQLAHVVNGRLACQLVPQETKSLADDSLAVVLQQLHQDIHAQHLQDLQLDPLICSMSHVHECPDAVHAQPCLVSVARESDQRVKRAAVQQVSLAWSQVRHEVAQAGRCQERDGDVAVVDHLLQRRPQ